jgi:hypothetical protein
VNVGYHAKRSEVCWRLHRKYGDTNAKIGFQMPHFYSKGSIDNLVNEGKATALPDHGSDWTPDILVVASAPEAMCILSSEGKEPLRCSSVSRVTLTGKNVICFKGRASYSHHTSTDRYRLCQTCMVIFGPWLDWLQNSTDRKLFIRSGTPSGVNLFEARRSGFSTASH